jgi:hypothetical protein
MRAFWSYDLFPYVLSGNIIETRVDGDGVRVKTDNFGGWFKPFLILEDEEGDAIHDKLVKLRAERADAERLLADVYRDKLVAIAPFMSTRVRR